MKKFFSAIVAFMLVVSALYTATASASWQDDYIVILENIGVTYAQVGGFVENGVDSVAVVDINNDGIPELIFTHIENNMIVNFSVYSFDGSGVNRIIHVPGLEHIVSAVNYDVYLTRDGTLIVRGGNGGEAAAWSSFYIFRNLNEPPEEVELAYSWGGMMIDDNWVEGEMWLINNVQVTQEAYEAELNRIYEGAAYRLIYDYRYFDFIESTLRAGTVCVAMGYQEAIDYLKNFVSSAPTSDITVLLNGQVIEFDVLPQIIDNRTMVPMRAIFEALGANVDWDEETLTVTATRGDLTVSLRIGSDELIRNDEVITLDVPPMIVDNRTLVPLRAISEAMDATIEWDEETRTITIETND
ncbi:MAG: copper amine oxidase N-terminal domain-containing protein [Oscillospiraceae bacterium]|nr:copper amine oxidase N-terminal domain-containing protein [Oscillospiraceae bacterium]